MSDTWKFTVILVVCRQPREARGSGTTMTFILLHCHGARKNGQPQQVLFHSTAGNRFKGKKRSDTMSFHPSVPRWPGTDWGPTSELRQPQEMVEIFQ